MKMSYLPSGSPDDLGDSPWGGGGGGALISCLLAWCYPLGESCVPRRKLMDWQKEIHERFD